jgi:hypothetical protein
MISDESKKSKADADLEREIRRGREFSLSEAIGRMAGPGMMKGVSPITGLDQGKAEIKEYIEHHLSDPGGALATVLVRGVATSEPFLENYDRPRAILASILQRVLASDYLLKELVRQADVEWGAVTGEQPHFEREGSPPDPDDPYTTESVRLALSQLLETLAGSTGPP